jgi:hypothetical protein
LAKAARLAAQPMTPSEQLLVPAWVPAEPLQQRADGRPRGSWAPRRQSPGAVAPWWMQPEALPSPEDGPPLALQAASRQWPGVAAEARSQSAAPGAAAASRRGAPELPAWAARPVLWPRLWAPVACWRQASAEQLRALRPPPEVQPADAAPGALPLPCAVGSPSERRRASTPATSRSSARFHCLPWPPSRRCGCSRAGSARARAAPHPPRASWSASSGLLRRLP